jgi:hypothetical protein
VKCIQTGAGDNVCPGFFVPAVSDFFTASHDFLEPFYGGLLYAGVNFDRTTMETDDYE